MAGVKPPQPSRLVRAGRAIATFLGLRNKASDLLKPGAHGAAPAKKSGGGGKSG